MAVVITRLDVSAADLREAAADARRESGATDAGHCVGARRVVARSGRRDLRDGAADAARLGASLQRVGAGGLTDRHRRNGQPRLSAEQQAKVAEWVERGPDLERDGVVRWRCVDLQQRIMQEFAVALHERTVGKLLRELSFRRLSVRAAPAKRADEQAVFRAVLPIS